MHAFVEKEYSHANDQAGIHLGLAHQEAPLGGDGAQGNAELRLYSSETWTVREAPEPALHRQGRVPQPLRGGRRHPQRVQGARIAKVAGWRRSAATPS